MIRPAILLTCAALALPAQAQDAALDNYVEANLLSIFYHEFGHAMIDIMGLPVLGQEEDAADTASVLMIDLFNDEETAQSILRDAAFGFLDEAAANDGTDPAWWDVHGPDLQRYYNMVCQFYGGNPDTRQTLAEDLDLPEERADSCEEEFDLAYDSFSPAFEDLFAKAPGNSILYEGGTETFTERLIAAEVALFNDSLTLPETLVVKVEGCDEANAFYDPNEVSIIMCREFEPHLRALGRAGLD